MPFKYCNVDEEYAKYEKLKRSDVEILEKWMEKQEHLPKISELKLIFFLQSCDFSLEQTKVCIEKYFGIRSKCPEFFDNRSYEIIKSSLESVFIGVLPKHTMEGYNVTILKLLDTDSENFNFNTHIKAIDMVVTLNSMLNGTANGEIMILDMEGASISHLLKINLAGMKKYMIYLQEGIHARIKGVHIVNASSLTDKLLGMVKPLLKQELFNIIHVHTKLDTLYKQVDRAALPREYGGDGASIQTLKGDIINMVKENQVYFDEEALEVLDESKRQGTPIDVEGIFGLDGSFKKLDID